MIYVGIRVHFRARDSMVSRILGVPRHTKSQWASWTLGTCAQGPCAQGLGLVRALGLQALGPGLMCLGPGPKLVNAKIPKILAP